MWSFSKKFNFAKLQKSEHGIGTLQNYPKLKWKKQKMRTKKWCLECSRFLNEKSFSSVLFSYFGAKIILSTEVDSKTQYLILSEFFKKIVSCLWKLNYVKSFMTALWSMRNLHDFLQTLFKKYQ